MVSRRKQARLLELPHRQRGHLLDEPERHGPDPAHQPGRPRHHTRLVTRRAKLAFATNRHGTLNFELYTIDADGTNPTRLTNNPALDLLPDW
jgi:hypothetical protein